MKGEQYKPAVKPQGKKNRKARGVAVRVCAWGCVAVCVGGGLRERLCGCVRANTHKHAHTRMHARALTHTRMCVYVHVSTVWIPHTPHPHTITQAVVEKQERRLGWGGFDDKAPPEKVTVIVRHMFGPGELGEGLAGAAELEGEVMEEAAKLGPVEKVGGGRVGARGCSTPQLPQLRSWGGVWGGEGVW